MYGEPALERESQWVCFVVCVCVCVCMCVCVCVTQGISVPKFREEMDRYLSWRAEAVTEKDIGKLMRRHLYTHLSWIVVWGSVFGLLTGIVVQALHISLNFDIFQTND